MPEVRELSSLSDGHLSHTEGGGEREGEGVGAVPDLLPDECTTARATLAVTEQLITMLMPCDM